MTDIEKVIKGVEQCTMDSEAEGYETQCHDCPYFDPDITVKECVEKMKNDALTLLKEQKEKKDRLLRHISDVQYTMGGFADQTTDYDKGRYDGLEAAWRIIDDMI